MVSIILFIIALKIDKSSTVKMFTLLDEDKRRLLVLLDQERDIEELKSLYTISPNVTTLRENLRYLKKMGLIKERTVFSQNQKVTKFIRDI
jgi:predicted transcriptional regulator